MVTDATVAVKVLDLFSGLMGWSQPFYDRGHDVFTIDNESRFNPHMLADIEDVDAMDIYVDWGEPDVVLASPPCQGFSVMNIGTNWHHDHTPKTDKAAHALRLVTHTVDLIRALNPHYFIIENPRAKLRKLPVMQQFERHTVTYCQYGEKRMKPTDLWGGFPPSLVLKDPCKNGMPCHLSAPRGSTTGTQGMSSELAAKIPYQLALDVCLAMERDVP